MQDSQYKDGYDKVLLNMGYRLWISVSCLEKGGAGRLPVPDLE